MPLGPRLALQGLHSGVDKINGSWILAVLLRLLLRRDRTLVRSQAEGKLPSYSAGGLL